MPTFTGSKSDERLLQGRQNVLPAQDDFRRRRPVRAFQNTAALGTADIMNQQFVAHPGFSGRCHGLDSFCMVNGIGRSCTNRPAVKYDNQAGSKQFL